MYEKAKLVRDTAIENGSLLLWGIGYLEAMVDRVREENPESPLRGMILALQDELTLRSQGQATARLPWPTT